MRKFLWIAISLLGYQLSYGQSQHTGVERIEGQRLPQWIINAQSPLKDKAVSIVNRRTGQKTKANLTTTSRQLKSYQAKPITDRELYEEDAIFIKFKTDGEDKVKPFSGRLQRQTAITSTTVQKALGLAKVHQMVKIADGSRLKGVNRIYKASLEENITVEEALEVLEDLPEVEYAERVPKYYTFAAPDDPGFVNGNQYALSLVHALAAFDRQSSPQEVYVGIVDDAFLYDHPDLAANVDVSKCYDIADDDADSRPPATGDNKAGPLTFSHGTHVGGIAGAVTNNGLGMASISNNSVKLFGIKATSDETDDPRNIEQSFAGVEKAIENGAQVINMSFGGAGWSQAWQDMINAATANGVIFVAAAGNGNTSSKNYPAAYDNVIAVANTNQFDRKDPSSHYGDWVDIAAPGADIYSTVVASDGTSGAYSFYSGTSMSAPMVAGLVGLMLSENNTLNFDEILVILQSTADDIDAFNPGFEGKLGAGRINVYNALLAAKGITEAPEAIFIGSEQSIYTGQAVTFSSQSLGSNLTYSWSFEGGSPASASGKGVTVTYDSPGIYDVTLTVTNSKGTDVAAEAGYITVEDPMACEILDFPFPGTRSLYDYIDNETEESLGPVVGHNEYMQTQFANKYTYLPGYYISGGLFGIAEVVSEDMEASKITFKVWEKVGASNIPGKVLAAQDVSFEDLVVADQMESKSNRASLTEVVFDNPPKIPEDGDFFMGFEIYYKAGDTVAFYTNEDGEDNGNDAYFYSEEGWFAFGESSFNANIEISPILVGEGYLNVQSFIAEAGACIGESVSFNAEAIKNAVAYQWHFEGGTPSSSTNVNPTVTYKTQGEYKAELLVTLQGCEVARRKILRKIKIVDCETAPVADFTVDRFIIAAGDSVHFFEQSQNATGYSWTFDGGRPLTASIADPYVTFPKAGLYEVRLEVQNPNAEVASLVREDYITVLEPDACDFYREAELNSPPPGSPTLYTADGGYIVGTNSSGDLAKVEYFEGINSKAYLNKLEIYFGAAYSSDAQAMAEVVVYDDNGPSNSPGDLIASKKVRISEIKEDVDEELATAVFFDNIAITGPFYAGVSLDLEDENDTIALVSSRDGEVEGTAWEKSANGSWAPTAEKWSSGDGADPLEISLHVSAFLKSANLFSSPDCTPLGLDEEKKPKNVLVWPNPFERKTNIEYELAKPNQVRLEIYNILGQLVDVVVNEKMSEGKHTAVFDASSMARGLYIYRLQIGKEQIVTGRMVLQ